MATQKKDLTEIEEGGFILNESDTFITTELVEGTAEKPIHQKDKLPGEAGHIQRSSAGPEEKDFTD